jgi:F-type H+-transporting ATPase subunit b
MFADVTFWVAVAFFAFMALLFYYKVPARAGEALDARADQIRQELEEARRLREEAQSMLAEYQRKQRSAEEDAENIIIMAKNEAKVLAEETRAKLDEMIELRTRFAESKIAQAQTRATGEVRAASIAAAARAAEKIIQQQLTPELTAKLIADNIDELTERLS